MIEPRPLYSTIPLAALTPVHKFAEPAVRRNDSISILGIDEIQANLDIMSVDIAPKSLI
jgi:hypothetical protein